MDCNFDVPQVIRPARDELIRQAAQGSVVYNDDTGMRVLMLKRDPKDERTGVFTSGIVWLKPCLANAYHGTVKQSRLRPIPLAGFELITYGRFSSDNRGHSGRAHAKETMHSLTTSRRSQDRSAFRPGGDSPRVKARCAMFVVSDREGDLISAARECQLAIEKIGSSGVGTKVFAQVGPSVGRAAFSARGITLAADVDVIESAPTPERLAEFIPGADHFFYSGHGARRGHQSGLVVVGSNGESAMFSENDILSMHVVRGRPIVVLSACETAMGGYGSSELFDTASSFLRIGARFVVGSLWLVTEDCATKFTSEFYEALSSRENPSKALGSAIRATRQHRSTMASSRAIPADHPIYWAPFMAIRGG